MSPHLRKKRKLVQLSGILGLILLSRLGVFAASGPTEGLCKGRIKVGDEPLDVGAQVPRERSSLPTRIGRMWKVMGWSGLVFALSPALPSRT
jgi:hypothetical protein